MAAGLPCSVIVPLQLDQADAQAGLLDYACRTSRGAVYLQCTGTQGLSNCRGMSDQLSGTGGGSRGPAAGRTTAATDGGGRPPGANRSPALAAPCAGPAASSPPTTATLDYLTHCLEPSAHGMPRCDVFPLLPFLGWTPQRVAALADAEEVIAAAEHAKECHALLDELNAARQAAGLPSLSLTLTAGHAEAADGGSLQQQGQQEQDEHSQPAAAQDQAQGPAAEAAEQQAAEPAGPAGPCSRVIGDWPHPHLQFSKVCSGVWGQGTPLCQ